MTRGNMREDLGSILNEVDGVGVVDEVEPVGREHREVAHVPAYGFDLVTLVTRDLSIAFDLTCGEFDHRNVRPGE